MIRLQHTRRQLRQTLRGMTWGTALCAAVLLTSAAFPRYADAQLLQGQAGRFQLVRHVIPSAAVQRSGIRASAGQPVVGRASLLNQWALKGFWFGGLQATTPVDRVPLLPTSLAIGAYPNPFTSAATLTVALSEVSSLEIDILDITGRRVSSLQPERASRGTVTRVWDGRDASGRALPSGSYLAVARSVALHGGAERMASRLLLLTR